MFFMKHYVELLRPSVSILGLFGAFVGAILVGAPIDIKLLIAMAVVFIISGAGNTINDYFDFQTDKVSHPKRPIPSGRIPRKKAAFYAGSIYLISIFLVSFLTVYNIILALVNVFLTIVYAGKLKRMPIFANLLPSWFAASSFLFGAFLLQTVNISVIIVFLLAFFSNLGREIGGDIEDMRGDRKARFKTIPILIGKKASAIISIFFILLAFSLTPIPYILNLFNIYYVYLVILSISIFVLSFVFILKKPKKSQVLMKIAMFVGVFSFLAGAL